MTARTRAELILMSLTIVWGSTFVLTKFVLENASPFAYVCIRFSIASVLFAILFYKRIITISKDSIIRGTILGFLLFIGFVLQTVGLKYTTASKSAFITGLMVVFTPLFQFLIEKKAPKIGNIIGVMLVAVGLFFLTSPKGSEFNFGDGLTLLCAVSFSLYTVYLTIYGANHDPAHLAFMQFIFSALFAFIAMLFWETAYINLSAGLAINIMYMVVMPTIAALYLMAKYQKYTTPTRSAIIYSLEPPFAALFAFFIIGERMGTAGIIGGIVILFGLLISELSDVIFKRKKTNKIGGISV